MVTWALFQYTKRDFFRKINWPLIFVGTYNVPPATGVNYSSWALVNITFNYWIKGRFFAWWAKYAYILAAALDTGTAIAGIIIFFAVSYPGYSFPDVSQAFKFAELAYVLITNIVVGQHCLLEHRRRQWYCI